MRAEALEAGDPAWTLMAEHKAKDVATRAHKLMEDAVNAPAEIRDATKQAEVAVKVAEVRLRRRVNNELNFPPNFERLVLGCIDADFIK